MSTPEVHNFGQRDAVRASLSLAPSTAERHNVFPLRPACACGRPGVHVKPAGCHPPRTAA